MSVAALLALYWASFSIGAQPRVLSPRLGNLEGAWRFATDPGDVGEEQGWQLSTFDDTTWRTLTVPGYWEPQGVTEPPPGQRPKPKNGMPWTDYDGVAWYRLRFTVPAQWAGRPLVLRLGSVDDQDRTFLNGKLVGATGPGIEPSVAEQRVYALPEDAVRIGGENVLAVRVFDGGGPGGLMGPLVSLLPAAILEAPMKLPQADRPLAERFADPPAQARILKIVHHLPETPEKQDALFQSLIAQGFGGVATNVSFDGYVESEDKWRAFLTGVRKAKNLGMSLWLYDERGYPSGTAGGLTMRDHPEWEAQGLFVAEAIADGEAAKLDLPPGELVRVAAFPLGEGGLSLDESLAFHGAVHDRKVTWQLPPGRWHVMAVTTGRLYENTHAAVSLHDKLPYVNLLLPEPTAKFLEVTHQQYADRLDTNLGRYFVSTFTDEPSLMSRFFRPMPYRVLPWSANLPQEFERRRGYALEPVLPLLIAEGSGHGKTAARVRYDFWLTIGELVSQNYFGQIQNWCSKHGLASGGHLLLEEPLCDHVALYGDFFRCLRRLDAPSMDCLTSLPANVPWRVARLVGSAAELNGDTVTMCETSDHVQRYRPAGDTRPVVPVSEAQIRGTCNRLMLGGINTITSYYSFAGLGAAQRTRLNQWVGRCCTMLTGGHQVTDIAVVYPIESVWPRFRPARHGATDSAAALKVQEVFNRAADSLYNARRDFTFIDARTLAKAQVEKGELTHRDFRWRVLVLPSVDTLPLEVWQNLRRFWQSGGAVVALSTRPANSEAEFPCAAVQAISAEVFGPGELERCQTNSTGGAGVFLPEGAEELLPAIIDGLLEPDVRLEHSQSPVRVTHRRLDEHDVYFFINDSDRPVTETVSVPGGVAGELWRPATGAVEPVPVDGRVALSLEPYDGVFLRFSQVSRPKRLPPSVDALPNLVLAPLPAAEPTVGKGEFVHGAVTSDSEHSRWRAVGTLTKADVDTFLFLVFAYPHRLDLTQVISLVFDSWAPETQRTPAELLMILEEESGAVYLARTGRPLNAAGHLRTFVPLTSFRLAGWSTDANNTLDLDRIVAVRVGWGGYFGKQGEAVEFSMGALHTARAAQGQQQIRRPTRPAA